MAGGLATIGTPSMASLPVESVIRSRSSQTFRRDRQSLRNRQARWQVQIGSGSFRAPCTVSSQNLGRDNVPDNC